MGRRPSSTLANAADPNISADPRYTFWRSAMDHIEHSRGHEWAFKGDVAYNSWTTAFLQRLKFGARYADRDQDIRYTTYNWGALSEVWWQRRVSWTSSARRKASLVAQLEQFLPRPDRRAAARGYYYNGEPYRRLRPGGRILPIIRQRRQSPTCAGARRTAPLMGCRWRSGPMSSREHSFCRARSRRSVRRRQRLCDAALRTGRAVFGNVRLDGNIGVRYVHNKLSPAGVIGVPTRRPRYQPAVRAPAAPDRRPSARRRSRHAAVTPGGVCDSERRLCELQHLATGIASTDTGRTIQLLCFRA